jgi:hypothetical protein
MSKKDDREFYIEDQEWAEKLQSDFEDYIWACESTLDYEEEEGTEPFETLSGEPFCGCGTCFIREQLFFLVPAVIKAYKNGQVVLTEDEEK